MFKKISVAVSMVVGMSIGSTAAIGHDNAALDPVALYDFYPKTIICRTATQVRAFRLSLVGVFDDSHIEVLYIHSTTQGTLRGVIRFEGTPDNTVAISERRTGLMCLKGMTMQELIDAGWTRN